MTRLFVPELGTRLRLYEPQTFTLHYESRNDVVWTALVGTHAPGDRYERYANYRRTTLRYTEWFSANGQTEVTLPESTVLQVDRIYVRKGASYFSSLSFNVISTPLKELTPVKKGGILVAGNGRNRFWARLDDVNRIEFELEQAAQEGS